MIKTTHNASRNMFYLYSCTINIGGLVFDTLHVFLIFTFTARQIFIFYKTNGANRNEQMKQLPISTES